LHCPFRQETPGPHERPQLPQLFGSFCVSVQVPLQSVVPVGQPQRDELQSRPPPQTLPQAPQLNGSLVRSTHDRPHAVNGGVQTATHWLA
jgi:hypothetical protein